MNERHDRKSQDKGNAFPDNTSTRDPAKNRPTPRRVDDERQQDDIARKRQPAR